MKLIMVFLLYLTCYFAQAQKTIQYYLCTFNTTGDLIELTDIKMLMELEADQNHLDNFTAHDNGLITYTAEDLKINTSQINFINLQTRVRGEFLKTTTATSQLEIQPETGNYSFVFLGKQDIIFIKDDSHYRALYIAPKIIDYSWINKDHFAVIEIADNGIARCVLKNIADNSRVNVSLNSGQKVCRISESKIAYVELFSETYR